MSHEGYNGETLPREEDLLESCLEGIRYYLFTTKRIDFFAEESKEIDDLLLAKMQEQIQGEELIQKLKELLEKIRTKAIEVGVSSADIADEQLYGYKKLQDEESKATEQRARDNRAKGLSPEEILLSEIFRKDIEN